MRILCYAGGIGFVFASESASRSGSQLDAYITARNHRVGKCMLFDASASEKKAEMLKAQFSRRYVEEAEDADGGVLPGLSRLLHSSSQSNVEFLM